MMNAIRQFFGDMKLDRPSTAELLSRASRPEEPADPSYRKALELVREAEKRRLDEIHVELASLIRNASEEVHDGWRVLKKGVLEGTPYYDRKHPNRLTPLQWNEAWALGVLRVPASVPITVGRPKEPFRIVDHPDEAEEQAP